MQGNDCLVPVPCQSRPGSISQRYASILHVWTDPLRAPILMALSSVPCVKAVRGLTEQRDAGAGAG